MLDKLNRLRDWVGAHLFEISFALLLSLCAFGFILCIALGLSGAAREIDKQPHHYYIQCTSN